MRARIDRVAGADADEWCQFGVNGGGFDVSPAFLGTLTPHARIPTSSHIINHLLVLCRRSRAGEDRIGAAPTAA